MDEKRSWAATIAAVAGAIAVIDPLLGPALIHTGLISPMAGFQLFFVLGGLGGALVALVSGLIALFRTRVGSGRTGRGLAYGGLVCGGVVLTVVALAASPGGGLPPINDITTDLEDPPAFAGDPSGRERDMAYPEDFVPQVEEAYPDLQPILLSSPPKEALELVEQTAVELGWEEIRVDPAQGTLEAQDVTRIFMFVDDVVVRVRPQGRGSVLDIRSKSRDGRGDLGANAARIRLFLEKMPR